jgi:hypothetical protein
MVTFLHKFLWEKTLTVAIPALPSRGCTGEVRDTAETRKPKNVLTAGIAFQRFEPILFDIVSCIV